jgi:23S rRNA (uracil1939-C5)-methyltransferase
MPNIVNDIRNEVRDFTILNAWPYFHLKTQAGWLRNLVVRMSESSGEIMVMLMVTAPLKDAIDAIFDNLKQKFPQISSFIWYVNDKRNDSYSDLKWQVWGESKPYIIEKLGKWQFYVSPNSFFQTNSKQANALYQKVYEAIGEKVDTLYDLYCGAGSISIFVSDKARKIVGLEFIRDAVADARKNADLNGLSHLEFFAGDIRKMLNEEFVTMHGQPDVVITDPPRAGMEPAVVEQLLAIAPKKIIYVSCNPASQARDISLMKDHYTIESVQPVDMFPQTTHVENITVLIRNSN